MSEAYITPVRQDAIQVGWTTNVDALSGLFTGLTAEVRDGLSVDAQQRAVAVTLRMSPGEGTRLTTHVHYALTKSIGAQITIVAAVGGALATKVVAYGSEAGPTEGTEILTIESEAPPGAPDGRLLPIFVAIFAERWGVGEMATVTIESLDIVRFTPPLDGTGPTA